jgi:hypothetical protein
MFFARPYLTTMLAVKELDFKGSMLIHFFSRSMITKMYADPVQGRSVMEDRY